MEVAILFLILVSVTTRAHEGFEEKTITTLPSWHNRDMRLLSLYLLEGWKEKWLGKISIIWEPEENSLLSESNTGNTALNLLSISMAGPLCQRWKQWT